MKAAIYNPYLDTLGGGERYTMSLAQILREKGWEVDVQWHDEEILQKLEDRLGLNLSDIKIVSNTRKGKGYDLIFWLSDGSIPLLWARKNILHFQVPFQNVGGRSFANKLKLRRIHKVICNSEFTKKFIDREYHIHSVVIYPPVDTKKFRSKREKENVILSVSRFSQLLQAKRQDILISTFKKIIKKGLKDWKLILAGGSDIGGEKFVKNLRVKSKGYPIEIVENPNFEELKLLYSRSKIFWSASGFGVNEEREPEKVEHFGITLVEAMAAGCIPAVVNKGGHKEIIKKGDDGFLWNKQEELISQTQELINNKTLYDKLSMATRKQSEKFSTQAFNEKIIKFIL